MTSESPDGRTASGVPITEELVATLVAQAEEGHDVDEMLARRRGREADGGPPVPPGDTDR